MQNNIMTFEDACKALNIAPNVPEVSGLPEKHQKAIIAHYKLVIIAQALNNGWEPNWSNWDEYKYFPWLEVKADESNPSGSGFSYTDYDYSYSDTIVGSRLCFQTRELALYAAKQFEDLYKDYLLIG